MGPQALEGAAVNVLGNPLVAAAVSAATVLAAPIASAEQPAERPAILAVVGAEGEAEYGKLFRQWKDRWHKATEQSGAEWLVPAVDDDSDTTDKDRLAQLLQEEADETASPLWLILIGHGTFDGRSAKFNLRGPDVSAKELAQWLGPFQRPLVIVNCASSSGPFINKLSGENRVVVTATRSGFEMNFARFGDYLSAAVADPAADLDKDGQTSLLEAFLLASARVREFYDQEARLATEQALLDDNGDGRGTPASWFRGIHPVRQAKNGAALDGSRAHRLFLVPSEAERNMPPDLRQRRDELERKIAALRQQKSQLDEDAYYAQLEPLLVELAKLYRRLDDDV